MSLFLILAAVALLLGGFVWFIASSLKKEAAGRVETGGAAGVAVGNEAHSPSLVAVARRRCGMDVGVPPPS